MNAFNQGHRHRLMSPWLLVACVLGLLISAIWFFPRGSVFQQLVRNDTEEQVDSVRVLLLQTLIEKGIQGYSLRREYIRQLALMKKYATAFEELDTLASRWTEPKRDSLWLLQVEVAAMASVDSKWDTARANSVLSQAVGMLLRYGSAPILQGCQRKTKACGKHLLTAKCQMRLAEIDSTPKIWQRKAATSFSLAGDCRSAAKVWMALYDQTLSQPEQRTLLLMALRELQSCNLLDEALQLAQSRIQDWEMDTEVLTELIALARAANRPKIAEQFARILVQPLAAAPEP
jgi:polysaccharide biosynthesis protein PelB